MDLPIIIKIFLSCRVGGISAHDNKPVRNASAAYSNGESSTYDSNLWIQCYLYLFENAT